MMKSTKGVSFSFDDGLSVYFQGFDLQILCSKNVFLYINLKISLSTESL